jgi:hypothetical protein
MTTPSAMLAASPTGARPAKRKGPHAPVVARPRRLGAAVGAVRLRKTRGWRAAALTAPLAWVTETDMEAGHGTKQAGKAASAETAHMPGA